MKDWRIEFVLAALLVIGIPAAPVCVWAFHSGGVGDCDGCHSIHNYQGAVMPGNQYLLKGGDAGSVCLNCHQQAGDSGPASYHVSTPDAEILQFGVPPKQLSPGGDFAWLKKTYTWNTAGGVKASDGDRHGHNIIAGDYNYLADATKISAPGGTYPSSAMTCISCHDPHGKYRRNADTTVTTAGKPIRDSGSYATGPDPDNKYAVGVYRLLGGNGYYPREVSASYAFIADPPLALGPLVYNRSEAVSLTRVGYGSGVSQWCRNCHTNIHSGTDSFTHPSPMPLGSTITAYYNSYLKSGTLTGAETSSYWSLVPFEVGTNNQVILKGLVTNTPTQGPSSVDGTPAVMCLSCHRAHASGWDMSTRWNSKTDAIVSNGTYAQEGQLLQPFGQGRFEAEALQAYYQIPAARYNATEPTFCYKCHAVLPPP